MLRSVPAALVSLSLLCASCSAPVDKPDRSDRRERQVASSLDPDTPAIREVSPTEVVVRAKYSEDSRHFPMLDKKKDGRQWRTVSEFEVAEVVRGECNARRFLVMGTEEFRAKGFEKGKTHTLRVTITPRRKRQLITDGKWPEALYLDEDEIEEVKGMP
jgi:hypothetical protein